MCNSLKDSKMRIEDFYEFKEWDIRHIELNKERVTGFIEVAEFLINSEGEVVVLRSVKTPDGRVSEAKSKACEDIETALDYFKSWR